MKQDRLHVHICMKGHYHSMSFYMYTVYTENSSKFVQKEVYIFDKDMHIKIMLSLKCTFFIHSDFTDYTTYITPLQYMFV